MAVYLASMLEIARHELWSLIRTKRAVIIAALYLALALIGGIAFVLIVRYAEKQIVDMMLSQGADQDAAATALEEGSQQAYRWLAEFFASTDADQIPAALRDSVILPAFFWCSLLLLPFVILLTSFDQLAGDLQARSICYSILRARRSAILFGKALAHTALFVVLTAVSSTVLVAVASAVLEQVSLVDSLFGLVRVWLLLIPFGLTYLAISSFTSVATKQPFVSLVMAFGIIIALRVVGWFRVIPEESPVAFLRYGRFLSPAHYHDYLWLADPAGPATGIAAYLGFAVIFFLMGVWRLSGRDL